MQLVLADATCIYRVLGISSDRLGILLGQKLIGRVKVAHEPLASGYLWRRSWLRATTIAILPRNRITEMMCPQFSLCHDRRLYRISAWYEGNINSAASTMELQIGAPSSDTVDSVIRKFARWSVTLHRFLNRDGINVTNYKIRIVDVGMRIGDANYKVAAYVETWTENVNNATTRRSHRTTFLMRASMSPTKEPNDFSTRSNTE